MVELHGESNSLTVTVIGQLISRDGADKDSLATVLLAFVMEVFVQL